MWTFYPATRNGFVNYDDPDYVTVNAQVQRGLTWENVRWAFCESRTSCNWHPVTMLSHMADCQWSGMNPWGHHLSSILLHAANAALLFVVLRMMTGATWRSLCVAALFGLHPLRVESVAWVSERKDVLSGLFWLLTLWAYARYAGTATRSAGKSQWLFYGLALLFFAVGLMSKPMLVTLPCVLLLLDYWPLGRFDRKRLPRLLLEKLPFLILSAASSAVTFLVQKQGGAMAMAADVGFPVRLGNSAIAYCRYLGKTLWPENLAVFYPFPAAGWPPAFVLCAGLLLLGITIFAVMAGNRQRHLPVGWFWFLGTMVPVIGLVQVGQQSMADRYTYIPCIGVFIAIVWAVSEFRASWRVPAWALSAVTILALAMCVVATRRQIEHWMDGETLFRHALAVTEENARTRLNVGIALMEKGKIPEAGAEFRRALELPSGNPHGTAMAHGNLGSTLEASGRADEAAEQYRLALSLEPGLAYARFNLGRIHVAQGRLDEAVKLYREAIRLDSENGRAHFFLGCVLAELKQADKAFHHLREAARIEPDAVDAQRQLAHASAENGERKAAILQWEKVVRLTPVDPEGRNSLGVALAEDGRFQEAIGQFREALRLKPGDPDAQSNLEVALSRQGTTGKP